MFEVETIEVSKPQQKAPADPLRELGLEWIHTDPCHWTLFQKTNRKELGKLVLEGELWRGVVNNASNSAKPYQEAKAWATATAIEVHGDELRQEQGNG